MNMGVLTASLQVTNEMVEFEKQLVKVHDFRKILIILEGFIEYNPI